MSRREAYNRPTDKVMTGKGGMKPRKRSKKTISQSSQTGAVDGQENAEERDPDQAWFWTEEWQQKEREADEDLKAGRYKTFDTMEEFLADLDSDEDE